MSRENLIPEGKWEAIPTGADLGETSTGKEQVGVSFDVPEVGRTITWYGYFTDDTAKRTLESLRICGWTGDDITDLSMIGDNHDLRVQLVIEHAEYKGEWSAKVRWVNRPGGVAIAKPLDQARKVALAQRMRGLAIQTAKSAAVAEQRQSAPRGNGAAPVTGHLDDDSSIPF